MTGRILTLLDHHAVIEGDYGTRYFMFRSHLARHHAAGTGVSTFSDLRVGMVMAFTPIEAGCRRCSPVALDARVTGLGLDEREGVIGD